MEGDIEFGMNFIIGNSIKLPPKMFLEGKNSLVITSHLGQQHTGYISISETGQVLANHMERWDPATGVIELIIYLCLHA